MPKCGFFIFLPPKPSFRNSPKTDVRNPENYNAVIWCLVPGLRGDVVWILRRRRTAAGLGRDDEFRYTLLR
jgi:hypothetical protein